MANAPAETVPAARQRPSRLRRLARGALVGFGFLALLELGLDVASSYASAKLDARPSPNGAGRRVLCVGDSWTFGVGAGPGESYPDFLQKHLGPAYVVINEGRPGINSSQISERLPGLITKHHPDVIILMAGMNNKHNTVGGSYQELIRRGYINPSRLSQALERADQLLWNLALYRLVRWSLVKPGQGELEFESLPPPAPSTPEPTPSPPAPASTEDPLLALDRAHEAEVRGDAPVAVAALREGFSRIHSARTFGEPAMNHLMWAREHATPAEFSELLDTLRRNLPPGEFQSQVQDALLLAENHSIGQKMLWFDMAKMMEMARQASAQLVLLPYPKGDERETMAAFSTVHGVPFIDTARFMARALTDRSLLSQDDRYAHQGRLSGHGNDEFAQFVVQRGRELGIFPR